MIILLPVLVLLIGAFVHLVVANAKVAELGRLAYAVGLFFTLALVARGTIRILAG